MRGSAIAVALLFAAASAHAVSRNEHPSREKAALAPVYQNDGDTATPFVVTPTTHTWTLVQAASSTRRRLDIEIINAATVAGAGVCLSTLQATAQACTDAVGGYELLLSTPQARVTLNGESAWYSRIRGGDTNRAALRGVKYTDSGD